MRPSLLPNLLPHRTRETPRPLHPRPPCHNLLNGALTHKVWVLARIIQQRRQQNQRSNARDCASLPEVLVTEYRLGYGLGLRFWCAEGLEEGQGGDAAVEFEREERGGHVCVCGAYVVEEGGEVVCLYK